MLEIGKGVTDVKAGLRRDFLKVACAVAAYRAVQGPSFAQQQPSREFPRPDPATFQSGDFVWPKKPGAYVPYHAGSANSPSQDREQWVRERDAYLRRVSKRRELDDLTRKRIESLSAMDYREFIAVYAGAQQPGVPGLYSGGSVYVGHVGLVEVDANQTPWIVEALLGKGVVRQTYSDWLRQRTDQVVWLGRLRQLDADRRARVPEMAKRYLGKPYDFWSFDLNDDSGFYCSKLAWLSIYRALGFAVDGDENPRRVLWFSPKQFLYLPTIERLHDPGPYATS